MKTRKSTKTTVTTDTGIMFSAPMVRAIKTDAKTVTRRTLSWANTLVDGRRSRAAFERLDLARALRGADGVMRAPETGTETLRALTSVLPAGRRLWVRETWLQLKGMSDGTVHTGTADESFPTLYAADVPERDVEKLGPWRSAMLMPRWASRLELEVVSTKIERLHDITPEQILAEGVRVPVDREGHALVEIGGANSAIDFIPPEAPRTLDLYLRAYWASGWSRINGRASWDANPLVHAITFRRVEKRPTGEGV